MAISGRVHTTLVTFTDPGCSADPIELKGNRRSTKEHFSAESLFYFLSEPRRSHSLFPLNRLEQSRGPTEAQRSFVHGGSRAHGLAGVARILHIIRSLRSQLTEGSEHEVCGFLAIRSCVLCDRKLNFLIDNVPHSRYNEASVRRHCIYQPSTLYGSQRTHLNSWHPSGFPVPFLRLLCNCNRLLPISWNDPYLPEKSRFIYRMSTRALSIRPIEIWVGGEKQ